MNGRKVAVLAILAAVIAAAFCVPVSEAGSGDVTVTPGDGTDVPLVGGFDVTRTVYVHNGTQETLGVTVGVTGLPEGTRMTYTVATPATMGNVLFPDDIAVVKLVFTAGDLVDETVADVTVAINLLDLSGGTGTDVRTVTMHMTVTNLFTSGDSYNKFFGIIPNNLGAPFDQPWFTALATLVLWLLITAIVSEIVIPLFTRLVGSRKDREERRKLTNRLTLAITMVMFAVAVQECAMIMGAGPDVLIPLTSFSAIIYIVAGAAIAWMVYMFVVTAFLKGLDHASDVDGMDMSLLPLFRMIGKLVIGVVAVCAVMAFLGVDLAGIMVSAGVVTLGITLGAQNTLNQFFSGIVLLASRPFKKGDFVKIEGVVYKVRRVRLMFTEVENWDADQIVTIPNNRVASATLVNLTSEFNRTRVFIYVDVAYGTDVEKAKASIVKAGMQHPHVIKDGSCSLPGARLTEFGDSGLQIRLACYVDDFDSSGHFAGQIRELIIKQLEEDGIEIPYNRIQVDILSNPPADGKI